ncbi:hypothetical protein K501DRAFT_269528 [Backusella circina FSU 941]|nr:hypothetical protein K501DRAFT_269528 [Backusella circina FSU 941]
MLNREIVEHSVLISNIELSLFQNSLQRFRANRVDFPDLWNRYVENNFERIVKEKYTLTFNKDTETVKLFEDQKAHIINCIFYFLALNVLMESNTYMNQVSSLPFERRMLVFTRSNLSVLLCYLSSIYILNDWYLTVTSTDAV